MIRVSIIIMQGGDDTQSFEVEMPQVPAIGEILAVSSQAIEPTIDESELKYRAENEGFRKLKVDSVLWAINRSIDKGSNEAGFEYALIECSEAG